jgi:translation elongation factor EF-4
MIIEKHYIKSLTEVINTQLVLPKKDYDKCLEEIYKYENTLPPHLISTSSVKSNISDPFIHRRTSVFNNLLSNIINLCNKLYPPITNYEYIVEDCWSVIYKKNDYAIPHNHLPSVLSFVYYFKSSGNTPLSFNSDDFSINPVDNTLVLFPSYLIHWVPNHNETEERICLSGNINYKPIINQQ